MSEISVINAALSDGKKPLPIGGDGLPPTTLPIEIRVAFFDNLSNNFAG